MSGTSLRNGVCFCWCGDRPIFLDLHSGRYFCLAPSAESAFRVLQFVTGGEADDARLRALLPPDLLVTNSEGGYPTACETEFSLRRSALDTVCPTASTSAMVGAGLTLLRVKAELRFRSLAMVIGRFKSRKERVRSAPDSEIGMRKALAAYAAVSKILSSRDGCLPWSIALGHTLLGRGVAADLVIGVTTRPFRAHCWVQWNDLVINDRIENVRIYTPILVV